MYWKVIGAILRERMMSSKREQFLLNLYFTSLANQKTLLEQTQELATELAIVCRKLREFENE